MQRRTNHAHLEDHGSLEIMTELSLKPLWEDSWYTEAMPTSRGTPSHVPPALRDTTNIPKAISLRSDLKEVSFPITVKSPKSTHVDSQEGTPKIFGTRSSADQPKDAYNELSKRLESFMLPKISDCTYSDELLLPTVRSAVKMKSLPNQEKNEPFIINGNVPLNDSVNCAPLSQSLWSNMGEHHTQLVNISTPHSQIQYSSSVGYTEPSSTSIFSHSHDSENDAYKYRPTAVVPPSGDFQKSREYSQLMQFGDLKCDKCGENIHDGNFRDHNVRCVGKKCNRCFQSVVGSYESHKLTCHVRKCDRCGIIPRETFKEHNRICKLISSSLWKRWHMEKDSFFETHKESKNNESEYQHKRNGDRKYE